MVSQFVTFLGETDSTEPEKEEGGEGDTEMKEEELKSQDSRVTVDPKVQAAYKKQID